MTHSTWTLSTSTKVTLTTVALSTSLLLLRRYYRKYFDLLDHLLFPRSHSSNDPPLSLSSLLDEFDLKLNTQSCIYLDYNATTPISSQVVDAMLPYLTRHYGNPSSSHSFGTVPREACQKARGQIAKLLGKEVSGESIYMTGCGTEANHMAIELARTCMGSVVLDKMHVVTSEVEHPAVGDYLRVLEAKGEIDVTYVPVNTEGTITLTSLSAALRKSTILVTLMLAQNESGALQPIQEVSTLCRSLGILFHTDAAQAIGKVNVTLNDTGIGETIDMVTLVGHKFGAPKGVAALYIRPGCLSDHGRVCSKEGALLVGGGQERGLRAGTENVPYIVGMGHAAKLLMDRDNMEEPQWMRNAKHMESLRKRLLEILVELVGTEMVTVNGPLDANKRLPNTLSVGFKHVHSGELVKALHNTVACSPGSACHSSGDNVSSVLMAMKVPMAYARGTLRLSVGPNTSMEDVERAATMIASEANRQYAEYDLVYKKESTTTDNTVKQSEAKPPCEAS